MPIKKDIDIKNPELKKKGKKKKSNNEENIQI